MFYRSYNSYCDNLPYGEVLFKLDSHVVRKMRARSFSAGSLSGKVLGTMHIGNVVDTVLGDDGSYHALYDCMCDCGCSFRVSDEYIIPFDYGATDHIRSDCVIGKNLDDLTGKHFHRWHVMYRSCSKREPSGKYATVWHCHCECGVTRIIRASSLKRGTTQSCGCYKTDVLSVNRDLTGQYFGRWHVLGLGEPRISSKNGRSYKRWRCECQCEDKTIRDVDEGSLVRGRTVSCGCFRKEQVAKSVTYDDLTGRYFGSWKVIERAPDRFYPGGGRSMMWVCECKCHAVHVVAACMLKSGISQSCGCNGSSVCESHVMTYLSGNGYRYEFQKVFSDLIGVGGKCLSYDFAVYRSDGSIVCLIECQGEQHYRPVKWFGGESRFEVQKEHDLRKRNYAVEHGISLVEITYKCRSYDDISNYLNDVFAGFNI